ncbi:MAG: tetraacyldisaccharide 4'-kinase [Parvularculaceae bacterium]
MMREPWFWRDRSLVARVVAASLSPAAMFYDAARRYRESTARPEAAPIPVFCVGNATVGGVGKTPFALLLSSLLGEIGVSAHFLTRGYGGALAGPVLVDPSVHDVGAVGDEALLLAAVAPTWVSRARARGAAAAARAGAAAIIMDDGYQNNSLAKTLSLLLIDADDPFGNGKMLPAGPLREPPTAAVARAAAIVYIVRDKMRGLPTLESDRPTFKAWLEPIRSLDGARVLAFCGIGRPQRFFETVANAGGDIADAIAFPDHHVYSNAEIARLKDSAKSQSARLVTTEKDYVRLRRAAREDIEAFRVKMACDDPVRLKNLSAKAIKGFRFHADDRHE